MFKIPILLISWRRPEKTLRVINEIKKVSPEKIYLACDGPIQNDKKNKLKVQQTREILNKEINWNCNVKKFYSERNNGCKIGVSKAITWFFENEEEGIILEDDCIPHIDFFYFCSKLLDKYRNDSRIWSISAHNHGEKINEGEGSYYFSRYNHCWGWASWRRCWQQYDPYIKNWPLLKGEKILNKIFSSKKEIKYWEKIFDNIYYKSSPNTWDYQWSYTCFINSGLTIIPEINLVNNIGFDNEATHTKNGSSNTINPELFHEKSGLFPLVHPLAVVRSKEADIRTENYSYSGYSFYTFKFYITALIKIFKKFSKLIIKMYKIISKFKK